MKRNCNLELQLATSSDYSNRESSGNLKKLGMESGGPDKHHLTIFYNGIVASCDATELQVRAIISLASRETEEKTENRSSSVGSAAADYVPTSGLSMKRSLQRFLEKRKTRVQSISPYSIPKSR